MGACIAVARLVDPSNLESPLVENMNRRVYSVSWRLGPEALQDLSALIDHADRLEAVDRAAMAHGPAANPTALADAIAPDLPKPEMPLARIVNALSNLVYLRERLDATSDEVLETLRAYLHDHASEVWLKENEDRLAAVKSTILAAMNNIDDDHPLTISIKADRLAFSQQNILTEVKILTDARPVFNASADKVLEMIIAHSLVIRYADGETQKKLHLSIDAGDLLQLKRIIERAEKKAEALRGAMGHATWRTVVVGEEGHE